MDVSDLLSQARQYIDASDYAGLGRWAELQDRYVIAAVLVDMLGGYAPSWCRVALLSTPALWENMSWIDWIGIVMNLCGNEMGLGRSLLPFLYCALEVDMVSWLEENATGSNPCAVIVRELREKYPGILSKELYFLGGREQLEALRQQFSICAMRLYQQGAKKALLVSHQKIRVSDN